MGRPTVFIRAFAKLTVLTIVSAPPSHPARHKIFAQLQWHISSCPRWIWAPSFSRCDEISRYLLDQKISRAMQNLDRLLVRCFGLNKTHRRSTDGLGNRCRNSAIIFWRRTYRFTYVGGFSLTSCPSLPISCAQ
jgi:hypothetical protein